MVGQQQQEEMRRSKPPQGHPSQLPSWQHLLGLISVTGLLDRTLQWGVKNWRKGRKGGEESVGEGKGIKTSKTKGERLGDSRDRSSS